MNNCLKKISFLLAMVFMLTAGLCACDRETEKEPADERPAYKDFAKDEPYRISYGVDAEGICVAEIDFNPYYDEPFILTVPEISPEGMPVRSVKSNTVSSAVPQILPSSDMERIEAQIMEAVGADSYDYHKIMAYYMLKGLDFCDRDQAKEALIQAYPITQLMNVYVLDITTSTPEYISLAVRLQHTCPDMDDSQYYEILRNMETVCKENGVAQELSQVKDYSGVGEYLTEIRLPSQVQFIDTMTFFGCENLTTVTVPGSVRILSGGAFAGCTSLKSITFEEGVSYISGDALYGCDTLQDIYLPSTLERLGDMCRVLSNVRIAGKVYVIPTIHYSGTQAEWKSLIEESVNARVLINPMIYEYYTVKCTDGDITASRNVEN